MPRSETVEKTNINITQLIKAHKTLSDALVQAKSLLEQEGVIQRFKYTFELTWQTLQDYLDSRGIIATNPRDVFLEAAKIGFIQNQNLWLQFLEAHNNTINTEKSQQEIVGEIYENIELFSAELTELLLLLQHKKMAPLAKMRDAK